MLRRPRPPPPPPPAAPLLLISAGRGLLYSTSSSCLFSTTSGRARPCAALFPIFLLLIQLAVLDGACFSAASSSSPVLQMARAALRTAPSTHPYSSESVLLRPQELQSSQHHRHQTAHSLYPTMQTESHFKQMSRSQALHARRMHRRLGFDLEKAYEVFCKKGTFCKGRRRPAPRFRMIHEVPSGPNPISNYLPTKFSSSWAPSSVTAITSP
ncbi:hypothetical protein L7F22_044600 [Adiantum nelumboides]|nr:hypothetical protein [Adiantum nelumboides]